MTDWLKDIFGGEWTPGFFDNPPKWLQKLTGNKTGIGWTDKICHWAREMIIVRAVRSYWMDNWWAFGIGVGVAVGYEVVRRLMGKEKISLWDIGMGIAGSLCGMVI